MFNCCSDWTKYFFIATTIVFGVMLFFCHMGRNPLDHIDIKVSNFARSAAFYDSLLSKLEMSRVMTFNKKEADVAGYGFNKLKPAFWIACAKNNSSDMDLGDFQGHICFAAPSRKAVDAWYEEGLRLGAKDNGKPGFRYYHPYYYAAFLISPDGHKLEAATHKPWPFA